MAILNGPQRVALLELVRECGEHHAARELKVGRITLARGLAGLEIAPKPGARIVAKLWLREQADASSAPAGQVLELRRGGKRG